MKHRICICILFGMLLISCNRGKNESSINSVLFSINLDSLNQGLSQESLIDSITYIPLETHPNGLITHIVKIIYSDNKFFILDRINRNGIMVFSDEGTFITTIGAIGRGPSEFIHLSNFDVYDDKLYIYDKLLKEIKVYSLTGEFINSFKIPNIHYDFSIIDSTRVLRYWAGSPKTNWKHITIYDFLNKSNSNDIPIHSAYNNNIHASPYYALSKHLFRSGDNILFNTYFSNIIYKSYNDTIIPVFEIISKAFINNKDIKRLIKSKDDAGEEIARENIIILSDIFQSENILTFSIKNKNPLNIVYNIKTNNFKDYSNSWKNQKLIDVAKIYGVKNNMFFSIIHPQLFIANEDIENIYRNHFLNTKHTKDFMNNGANSNPVVAIFKFKEF